MYFLLSGEGTTDVGDCANNANACEGADHLTGPSNPYQGCGALENRSGNDNSPNSLKSELAEILDGLPSPEELCKMVTEGRIDIDRVDMPSFTAFRQRLEQAII